MKRKHTKNVRCFNKHSCCPFALSRQKSGSYEHVPLQMFSYILRATLLEVPNFYSCHNIYILILPIQILHVLVICVLKHQIKENADSVDRKHLVGPPINHPP